MVRQIISFLFLCLASLQKIYPFHVFKEKHLYKDSLIQSYMKHLHAILKYNVEEKYL